MPDPLPISYATAGLERAHRPWRFRLVAFIGILIGILSIVSNVFATRFACDLMPPRVQTVKATPTHVVPVAQFVSKDPQPTRAQIWFLVIESLLSIGIGGLLVVASCYLKDETPAAIKWSRIYGYSALTLNLVGFTVAFNFGNRIWLHVDRHGADPIQLLTANLLVLLWHSVWPIVLMRTTSGEMARSYLDRHA